MLSLISGATAGFCTGALWYFTERIKIEGLVPSQVRPFELRVLDIGEGYIELDAAARMRRHGDWRQPGLWGIETPTGYGRVGEIIETHATHVRREFEPVEGDIEVGDAARLDVFVYRGDPRSARGLDFIEAAIASDAGELPAWFVPGANGTWVILVHGKGSNRCEALRILPLIHRLGYPSLTITYRNDAEHASDAGAYYAYGLEEWPDLEAAVVYAFDHGAERVLLYGFSMGGSIAVNLLYRSTLASKVAALVLDSPMLDFAATLRHGASHHGVPSFFTELARRAAAFRFAIDWQALDYASRVDQLNLPVLLFHTAADHYTPVSVSDGFARSRPDIVTYVRATKGGHTRIWNTDPESYEARVSEFLAGCRA